MFKRIPQIIFVALCLTFTIFAQANLDSPIPIDPNVRIGKLENGLTYYVRKNSKPENKVELRLAVNAGSILEDENQQGLAHFLEHMSFNGTKNFKKNELVSYLQSIGVQFGADLNAYTGFDETVYILSIPTEKKDLIDKGLLVLSDWATGIELDPYEIEKERGVVLEELRIGTGANQRMRDKYFPLLFKGSKYAERLPIGKEDVLKTFERKTLLDFYETWYRPELMAIVAVGDLDIDEMEKKIKAKFSGIKARNKTQKRPIFEVPDHKETLITVATDKEAALTSATIYYKKPLEKKENLADFRKSIVKSFFNEMLTNRLREVQEQPNPPYMSAGGRFSKLGRTKGSFSMFGVTDPKKLDLTIKTLLEENKRLQEFGFTKGEFERAKNRYLSQLENTYKERDTTQSRRFADEYIRNFLDQEPIPGIEFEHKFAQMIVPIIKLEEINAVANDATSEENRVLFIMGSEKDLGFYPTKDEIIEILKNAETAKVEPYKEEISNEPLVENLAIKATIKKESIDKELGITYLDLSNGVKVALKPTDFQSDEIIVRAFSPGGTSLVSDEKALSAEFVPQIVMESGLKNFSKVQLEKKLAGNSAVIWLFMDETHEFINGNSNAKDFETMMQLLYLRLTDVNFDKETFDSYINKQKQFVQNHLANPQVYYSEEANKILNQNHPRAFGITTVEQLNKVEFEQVKSVYKDRYGDTSDFTFIIVGNFEIEKIKPQILKYLGNLPNGNRVETSKDLGIRTPIGGLKKIINKGIDNKSLVQIRFAGEAKYNLKEEQYLSFLGELLDLKLVEVLREEKSGVYRVTARGNLYDAPYERFRFFVYFPTAPENVDSLIKATFDEIEKIQKGQIDEKDLAKIKEALLVKAKENFKGNQFWGSEISKHLSSKYKMFSLQETESRIKAITRKDLQKAANKYLKKDEAIQIILMPENKTDK